MKLGPQHDCHGRRYVEFRLRIRRPGADGVEDALYASLADLDSAFLAALSTDAEFIEAETATADETGQRTAGRWARRWNGIVERRPTEESELAPCAPDGSFLPDRPAAFEVPVPAGIPLVELRRREFDSYFAKAPFPTDDVPFGVVIAASEAAPPRRRWDALQDAQTAAMEAHSKAVRALRRRLEAAGIDITDRLAILDTSVSPPLRIGTAAMVLGADGRYRATAYPSLGTSRRHPLIRKARATLAGAWWPYVPMPPGPVHLEEMFGNWTGRTQTSAMPWPGVDILSGSEARTAAAQWTIEDRGARRSVNGWGRFSHHAQREAALLAELTPLNLDRRKFRIWAYTTILISQMDDHAQPDEPASVSALVKWPFAIRRVEDDGAPAPFRLIHLPCGHALVQHADPQALRRFAAAVTGLVDWEWRSPTPCRMAEVMHAIRPHLPAGTWIHSGHGLKLVVGVRRATILIPADLAQRVEKRAASAARRRDKAA